MQKIHGFTTIPEVNKGQHGVLFHNDMYYYMCVYCGLLMNSTQANYSIGHYQHPDKKGMCVCMKCQKLKKTVQKVYSCPEHVQGPNDAYKIKGYHTCQKCEGTITNLAMILSLEITEEGAKKGRRYCKKCLIEKFNTYKKVEETKPVEEILPLVSIGILSEIVDSPPTKCATCELSSISDKCECSSK